MNNNNNNNRSATPLSSDEHDHPHMLGSYRGNGNNHSSNNSGINSAKFADRFSGLLPSLSSKFHHSTKPQQQQPPPQPQPPTIEVNHVENKLVTSVMNGGNITINSPHDMLNTPDPDPPVQFPTSSHTVMLNNPVRSRQRTNTVPMNWVPIGNTNSNNNTKTNSNVSSSGTMSTPRLTRSNTNYSENSIWSSNDFNSTTPVPMLTPVDTMSLNPNNVQGNNLNVNSVRKRSQTLAAYDSQKQIMSSFQPQRAASPMLGMPMMNNNSSSNSNVPLMQDDVDPFSLVWITTNQKNIPHVNSVATVPTSSTIAISNIFPIQWSMGLPNIPNMTSVTLATIFSHFGKLISVRTLRGLNMCLIEFESRENAMLSMDSMQEQEISMVGVPCKITFAKILSYTNPVIDPTLQKKPHSIMEEYIINGTVPIQIQNNGLQIPIFNDQINSDIPITSSLSNLHSSNGNNNNTSTTTTTNNNNGGRTVQSEQDVSPFPLPPPGIISHENDIMPLVKQFEDQHLNKIDDYNHVEMLLTHGLQLSPCFNMSDFGSMPEPIPHRMFETPKLREIRKSLDNNLLTCLEIEQLALCMLDELPELSLDYLGNTIVQRIYDKCDDLIRDIILRKLQPYLSIFGIHKSGTWVCQKLIKTAKMARHIQFIVNGVELYCCALFNDQFGNYVIQEVVKFGPMWNQFIFDNILMNFWTICVNRYGVRAIRACLETTSTEGKVTSEQMLIISSIIILYSEYLITDHNGTLLITWLLDTSSFANKYYMLTRHIIPYLSELCCHKLGSLTVLKILNSRGNEESKRQIIETIFDMTNDNVTETLRYILRDQTLQGSRFIYKMITSRLVLDTERKELAIQQIKTALLEEPQRHQQHHRLMEEVGLITTNTTQSRW